MLPLHCPPIQCPYAVRGVSVNGGFNGGLPHGPSGKTMGLDIDSTFMTLPPPTMRFLYCLSCALNFSHTYPPFLPRKCHALLALQAFACAGSSPQMALSPLCLASSHSCVQVPSATPPPKALYFHSTSPNRAQVTFYNDYSPLIAQWCGAIKMNMQAETVQINLYNQ